MDASEKDVRLSSLASYQVAQGRSDLNLSRDAPISGSYSGVDPMGLFTSMDLTSDVKIVFKMVNGKIDGWDHKLRIFDGQISKYSDIK